MMRVSGSWRLLDRYWFIDFSSEVLWKINYFPESRNAEKGKCACDSVCCMSFLFVLSLFEKKPLAWKTRTTRTTTTHHFSSSTPWTVHPVVVALNSEDVAVDERPFGADAKSVWAVESGECVREIQRVLVGGKFEFFEKSWKLALNWFKIKNFLNFWKIINFQLNFTDKISNR